MDPIVASFSGGAVGVLSSLMIVELNNVSLQEEKKCHYCKGSGEEPTTAPCQLEGHTSRFCRLLWRLFESLYAVNDWFEDGQR